MGSQKAPHIPTPYFEGFGVLKGGMVVIKHGAFPTIIGLCHRCLDVCLDVCHWKGDDNKGGPFQGTRWDLSVSGEGEAAER